MFSDDSDGESLHTLTINEHYAKAFQYRKEREELAKLKEKYGSDVGEDDIGEDDEDSEDAESEDEDGEELTPAVDAAILRTLARIKRKDPAIYEQGADVFEEERKRTADSAPATRARKDKNQAKPVTMRAHALASALEGGSRSPSPEPTHVEQQERLRTETIAAFHGAFDGSDEEEDVLVLREKTKDELEREEEEYEAFLEREVGQDISELVTVDADDAAEEQVEEERAKQSKKKKDKGKGKEKAGKSKQEEDQEFLMNYILNRGWIDRSTRRLPTYQEITRSKKPNGRATSEGARSAESGAESVASGSGSESEGNPDLDEDEFDEVVDRFESSYNFRFEEPDAATIARHPRNLPSLVRRQDTARKEAREKRKARKEEELQKKKEEVRRLKALKMKELRAKLERIGHEGGKNLEETKALQDLDLEGDWDPDAHDRQMAELYAGEMDFAEGMDMDDEKPHWDDDIDITDIVPPDDSEGQSKKKSKKNKKKKGREDADDVGVDVDEMDAAVERAGRGDDGEEWDGTEEMRKKKLEEYMDEVYALDFNDMVGDMPTRFKYAKVEPSTFSLTPAEILMATDAELNSYVGIKKYAPYRKDGKGRTWDAQRGARLKELRDKLKERGIEGAARRGDAGVEKAKKRKGKKERMRAKAEAEAGAAGGDADEGEGGGTLPDAAPDKKKRKAADEPEEAEDAPEEVEGGAAKKKRRRHRKSHAATETS